MNNEEQIPKKQRKFALQSVMRWRPFKREPKTIKVVIPENWMNCAVTVDNNFIADTNDSSNCDNLKFPLPKPKHKWHIKSYTGDMNRPNKSAVVLIDKP